MMSRWERWDEIMGRVEKALVTVLLSLMILVAFSQILLRNVLGTGFSWGDPLVRNLVVWVGFVGAAMATREGKHINMEVFSKWVSGLGKAMVQALVHLFSAFICALLTLAALRFLVNEAQMGHRAFLGLPAWVPEIIIPATFALMTLRFGLAFCREAGLLVSPGAHDAPGRGS
jgi:TRAP-type C4-dicarboxylate transport system permease small subunit